MVEKEVEEAQEQLEDATEAYEAANREFLIATVEPRVEATKLRFEEHKLRATLSSASIVGIAATSGILLPHSPSYVAVLGVSFCCLFLSTILTLEAMKRTSEYVEGTLIRGSVNNPKRLLAWLTRHTFTAGLIVFAIFVVLNLQF